MPKTLTAQQLAAWIDTLRHISAEGLFYAGNEYDRERYTTLQTLAMQMTGFLTDQSIETLGPLRENFFARHSPFLAGAAAVIDSHGSILLMRRSDNGQWAMPAGGMNVGETPARAVVRETYEETGVRCQSIALVGVYDSRLWKPDPGFHVYMFTFLCQPVEAVEQKAAFRSPETLETGWFSEDELPENVLADHLQRIRDAYRVWRGNARAYFDN